MNGLTAVVGVGESEYFRRGRSEHSELVQASIAIKRAALDAGIDHAEIDGFVSYSGDRTRPTVLARALGANEVRYAAMVGDGGGGGCAAAVATASMAVAMGQARVAVVYRSIAQLDGARFGQGAYPGLGESPNQDLRAYGVIAPAQTIALQVQRFLHDHGLTRDTLAAVALNSYRHAQRNPRAVMYGKPLSREQYDAARMIVEPFGLYDCCQESDGAAAIIITDKSRARDCAKPAALVAGASQGATPGFGARDASFPSFGTANFVPIARRLYESTGVSPADIDVLQCYENFTGGVVAALIEHGFCTPEQAPEFMTEDNFYFDGGGLPLNTSGGNLAEAYIHGLQLVVEAVRQIRGESTSQVADVSRSMVIGGPYDQYVSNLLLEKDV